MSKEHSTSAVILAGGVGKRFGSYKPVLSISGQTLLEHLVRRVRGLYDEILIVVGTESQKKQILEECNRLTILIDSVPGKGPIGGIMTGATFAHAKYCQILPVDSPLPCAQVLRRLETRADGANGAVPTWPDGRIEPLHSVYRTEATARLSQLLIGKGERSVISLVRALTDIRYVSIDELRELDPDLDTFANINTRDDLERMRSKLGRESSAALHDRR